MQTAEIAKAIRQAQNALLDKWGTLPSLSGFGGPLLRRASWPAAGDPGLTPLVELLRLQPELAMFSQMQFIGRSGRGSSLDDLACWLIRRTEIVGADTAAVDLQNYVEAAEFEATEILAIGNVQIPGRTVFHEDLVFVPFDQLEETVESEMLRLRHSDLDRPSVVLCAPVRIPRRHGDSHELPAYTGRIEELLDASRVLTLAGTAAPMVIGTWMAVRPEVPLGDRGTGILFGWSRSPRATTTAQLTAHAVERAGRLYGALDLPRFRGHLG